MGLQDHVHMHTSQHEALQLGYARNQTTSVTTFPLLVENIRGKKKQKHHGTTLIWSYLGIVAEVTIFPPNSA